MTPGASTILLVDDEDVVRGLVREVLLTQGYEVLEAFDGDGAVLLAARHDGPLDLLLTDVAMPGLSGPEAAELIRRIHPSVQVVFMSGHWDAAISDEVPFLQKPFTPAVLARTVRHALGGAAALTG